MTTTETIGELTAETEKWVKTIVKGVQWADNAEKSDASGKISVATYSNITFPEGTYSGLVLSPSNEEDAIFLGVIEEDITGKRGERLSDLMERHPKSGRIKQVNDNSNRTFLKNIKVVVG